MPPRQVQLRHSRQESRDRIVAAATELVRHQSYGELSIGAVMERAGFGRTIFYRHFDDLGDLLVRASRDAIDQLYSSQRPLAETAAAGDTADVIRESASAVAVYERHGPPCAPSSKPPPATPRRRRPRALRRQFDGPSRRSCADAGPTWPTPAIARALNLLNESYLLDAFGREPRVSTETAVQTLTEIWLE
jgi:AcrR family transcriptional regulator